MTECPICQHPKVQAINNAMGSGLYVGVIARQYRLDLLDLERHRDHWLLPNEKLGVSTLGNASPTQALPDYPGKIQKTWREFHPDVVPMVTENPESQFKQAWQMAKDDDRMRARMVQWLNEQIQADDEGMP